jgi:selenocysteine lyase/cysteine desulfurase
VNLRTRFPILERLTYLNACSHGALATDVADAYHRYLEDRHALGSPWEMWMGKTEETRAAFARLVGASPDEIAITTSASAGVSSIASAFDFSGPRNRVVTTDFEFPTVGQIWHAQEQRGAEVVHVPAGSGGLPLEGFEEAIDERTAIVSITHICYWNGHRLDVPGITEIAHRHGASVLLDSYQALGAFPADVADLGVDFLVGGTIKYLLGPAGLAFVYARGGTTDHLTPTAMGWFSQANVFAMDPDRNDPAPDARRFEYGTPPIPNLYAGLAGMELLEEIGAERTWDTIKGLTGRIADEAAARELELVTPADPDRRGALMAIRSTDVEQLVRRLGDAGIVTSSRAGNLRISPHVYNDESDIERLFEALDANRRLLA